MAISPVSAITYGNNYNSINFGNKKKKENHNKGISVPISHKLAVPLAATVLAMAPTSSNAKNNVLMVDNTHNIEILHNTQNEGRVVDKNYFKNIYGQNKEDVLVEEVTVKLLNSRDKSNNFDKIMYNVRMNDPSIGVFNAEAEHPITDYSDITYQLISDDGRKGPSFNIKSINVEGNSSPTFVKDDQNKYIEKAIYSDENKSDIKIHKYTRGLRHSGSHMENVSKGNIMKDAVTESEKVLGKLAGTNEFGTKDGQYIINYYSKDDNMNDAEFVTVKRDDGPELRLVSVEINNAVVNPGSCNPVELRYGYVVTTDGKNLYTLFDDNLVVVMLEIFKNSAFDNAKKHVNFFETKSQYMTTTKGVIMNIADVDD